MTDVEPLAAKLAQIQHDIALLREEEAEVKAGILSAFGGELGTVQAGNLQVRVSANRRFHSEAAIAACHPDLLPLVTTQETVTVVDRARMEVLAPDAYQAGWKHGDPSVRVL